MTKLLTIALALLAVLGMRVARTPHTRVSLYKTDGATAEHAYRTALTAYYRAMRKPCGSFDELYAATARVDAAHAAYLRVYGVAY